MEGITYCRKLLKPDFLFNDVFKYNSFIILSLFLQLIFLHILFAFVEYSKLLGNVLLVLL